MFQTNVSKFSRELRLGLMNEKMKEYIGAFLARLIISNAISKFFHFVSLVFDSELESSLRC